MPESSPREQAEIPETSRLEEETRDSVLEEGMESEGRLDEVIGKIFSQICRENGKQEFFQYTVPAVKRIYGSNYRKAASRLLEIIDEGSDCKPGEIGKFFKNAVAKAEFEFSEKNKNEIVNEITQRINDLIREQEERYGKGGVVAAIIIGSYANRNFTLGSDLDVVYVTGSKEAGRYIPEEERYVRFPEEFDFLLNKQIWPTTNPDWYPTISMDNLEELGRIAKEEYAVGSSYIVVTPDAEVRKKIEHALKTEGPPHRA